jgi:thioester reductase-like protein
MRDVQPCENITIGKPIENTRIYILNKDNSLQPMGIAGELSIAGNGLARGYLGRPELTAEKFVENPYKSGERMYRTGDLARWLPNGNIEFLGRIDHQVKIRGYRIEFGEIEEQLLRFPSIKQVVLIAREDSQGSKYLCAYVVVEKDLTIPELRAHLTKELPDYMVPSYFVQLENLPLTVNGKLDRKALPEPDGDILTGAEYAAPENEMEEKLIQIWQSVLKVERIGINDNFFELGGHSLKAIQLLSKLSVDFKVSMNDIFECSTVKSLAGRISYSKGYLKKNIELIKAKCISAFEIAIAEKGIEYNEIRDSLEEYEEKNGKYATIKLFEKQNYKSILLTGGTGYLGIHVLRQLLFSTGCDINILVRGKNEDEAEQKLVEKLKYYFGDNLYDQFKERINVIKGDLTEEYFGLTSKEYNNLADRVDCVLNSAANVKHYGKFEDFHEINVKGTERLINFCKAGKTKDFNHVSTVSIGSGNVKGKRFGVFTEYDTDIGQEYDNYYLITKFEAEKLISNARADGLNCNVFRVGNIVFDSETGKFQENITDNAFYKLIRAGIKLGLIAEMSLQTRDFSCADYVSKAIALLFDKSNLKNETYHISNPYRVATFELESAAKDLGYVVKIVPLDEFLDYITENVENSTIETYIADMLLHAHVLANSSDVTNFRIESSKTETVLKGLGFEWPQLNHQHIYRMLEHCKKVDFI